MFLTFRYNEPDDKGGLPVMTKKTNVSAVIEAAENEFAQMERFDADSYWKELIDRFAWPLIQLALPELYEAADTRKKPKPLDKEFRDILNTGDPKIHKHPHYADFILEIPMKHGMPQWIILHFEIQGRRGGDLNVRMYHYKSAIFFHYKREPVALAIITHKRPKREADHYEHSHFGTESVYRYNRLVLAELDDDALLADPNPMGILLYAAKNALRTRAERQKYNYLRTAMDCLAERGWNRKDKRDLMLFIERIVRLRDEELIAQYNEHWEKLDKEGKIMYIPLMEREKAKKLFQSGIEKGKEDMARDLLRRGVEPDVIAESAGLSLEKIQALVN
jgi:hypothetical protein